MHAITLARQLLVATLLGAATLAHAMKQPLRLWVLWPR